MAARSAAHGIDPSYLKICQNAPIFKALMTFDGCMKSIIIISHHIIQVTPKVAKIHPF